MLPLAADTVPVWVTVLLSILAASAAIVGLILNYFTSKSARESAERQAGASRESAERQAAASRESAERQAKESRESSERQARESRDHAAREARTARLIAQREDVYSSALESASRSYAMTTEMTTAKEVNMESIRSLKAQTNDINLTWARLELFGSPESVLAWEEFRKSVVNVWEDIQEGDFGRADSKLPHISWRTHDFARAVRLDVGVTDASE